MDRKMALNLLMVAERFDLNIMDAERMAVNQIETEKMTWNLCVH